MLYLAYDGSLNGDWVARYAFQLALAGTETELQLLYVQDGQLPAEQLASKLESLTEQARLRQLTLGFQNLPQKGSVAQTLLQTIPSAPEHLLLCGTRARPGQRALLAGTTAQRLLEARPCPVLALRVVHPGLLGQPHKFLIPLAGHPRLLQTAFPLLQRLLIPAEEIFLLRVMPITHFRHRHLSDTHLASLRQPGAAYLEQAGRELLATGLAPEARIDWRVVLSDDWVSEILLHCSHFKTQFALLGASERLLSRLSLPGNSLERILHGTPCDVGIYRGPD